MIRVGTTEFAMPFPYSRACSRFARTQTLPVLPEPSQASIGSSVQPVLPEPVPHGGGPRVRCLAPVNLRLAEDAQPLGARERALVRPRREGSPGGGALLIDVGAIRSE